MKDKDVKIIYLEERLKEITQRYKAIKGEKQQMEVILKNLKLDLTIMKTKNINLLDEIKSIKKSLKKQKK